MCLNGRDDLELVSLAINGSPLPESAYTREPKMLTITAPPPGEFELSTVTHIKPQDNTSLEGLYKSGGNFSSQVLHHFDHSSVPTRTLVTAGRLHVGVGYRPRASHQPALLYEHLQQSSILHSFLLPESV